MAMATFTFSIVCTLSLASVTSISLLYVTIIFARKLFAKSENFHALPPKMKMTRISAIAAFIFPMISTLSVVVLMLSQIAVGRIYTTKDAMFTVTRWSFFVFLILWFMSVYTFLLTRLIVTFQDSVYSIPKCVVIVHSVMILLMTTTGLVAFALTYDGHFGLIPGVLLLANFLGFVAGFAHLGHAFAQRLFELIVTQRRTVVHSAEKSLGEQQLRILVVIRKNALLATVQATVMSCTVIAYVTTEIATNGDYWPLHVYPVSKAYYLVTDVFKLCMFLVSSMCVYLGFTVNAESYARLCKRCDAKCESLCQEMAHRRVEKQTSALQQRAFSVSSST